MRTRTPGGKWRGERDYGDANAPPCRAHALRRRCPHDRKSRARNARGCRGGSWGRGRGDETVVGRLHAVGYLAELPRDFAVIDVRAGLDVVFELPRDVPQP